MTDAITYTRDLNVYSSLIEDAYYNDENGDLFLEMNEDVYRYANVPVEVANGLLVAASAGRYYNENIKGKYDSENLGYWAELDYVNLGDEVEDGDNTLSVTDVTDNVMTANTARTQVFSLTPIVNDEAPVGKKFRHTVKFDVLGTERVYATDAGSNINESIEALTEIADMLGLDFTVKEVVVTLV